MINVVEAISDGNIGGAGVLLITRLKNSDRNRYKTTVIVPKGSMLVKRLKEVKVNVVEISCKANRSFYAGDIFKLIKVIKCIKPDIINSHGWLSFRIAALFSGVPVRLYTSHCLFSISRMQKNIIVKKVFSIGTDVLSHKVVAVADAVKDNLIERGISPQKIITIINGVEKMRKINNSEAKALRKQLMFDDEETVVCINARLERYKGHECLLRAVKILKKKGVKIKCLIIGDGSLRCELEEKARMYGLKKDVVFTGFVEDPSPYINISYININCSVGTETSSLALSEGMSLGKPSVVSDFGGNNYMVKDGENGYVFKQNDYETLSEKILILIKNKDIYKEMSKAAYNRFKNELNAAKMTKETETLYCNLLLK